ncbi:helix-turn-helix domain-containing protein [Georgenia sp. MJ170]|uniref:helix-turn-helix domain-containing protein n=1 Tax=Georgenia sunbinii TaxID=3117728 RepID=UPI002F26C01A
MTGWDTRGLLTRDEVAELLRADSPRTVDWLRKERGLPAVLVGRSWRFRQGDVEAWVEASVQVAS